MDFPDKKPLVEYTHTLRSRYGETDAMGYVYHGHYLQYFEVARTEMIRSYGLSYREMENSGIMLPVIKAELEYKAPIIYDEEIYIKVLIFDRPVVRLETYYEVSTPAAESPNVYGHVTLCFMDAESRKPCRAPREFIDGVEKQLSN